MLIWFATLALAGGPVTEGAVVYETRGDGQAHEHVLTFKDGRLHSRVVQGQAAELWVDTKASTAWLRLDDRPAIQTPVFAVRAEDAFVQPLGQQRFVQGYPCDGYEAELLFEDGRSARMTVWSTPVLDPGFDALVLAGAPFGLPGVAGLPLLAEVELKTPDGPVLQEVEAVSLDLSAVPLSRVSPPPKVRHEGAALSR